jgi:hypothetical protein
VYRDSGLSRFPRYYFEVDDLPIIVSYPITSLMLFVHLHIVWYNRILTCCIYSPMSRGSSMQWDPVWRLYRPLGGLPYDVRQQKVLDIAIDEVSRALSMHVAPLAIQIVVVPIGVIVPLGLHNPPHRWSGTVDPSLPNFTIAPCVDSLLRFKSIRQPKYILQGSPDV